jgi:hypothetical protein
VDIRSNALIPAASLSALRRAWRGSADDDFRWNDRSAPGLTAARGHALDGPMTADESIERFAAALGLAAIDLWSELPQEIQQRLFEHAVVRGHQSERDESLREQLAQFLHAHHERTAKRNAGQTGAV